LLQNASPGCAPEDDGLLAKLSDLICHSATCFVGEEMSLSNHGRVLADVFKALGIQTTKKTHELRIFAAQLLHEMSVPLEVRLQLQRLMFKAQR
jgi:hypothetical protein